MDMDMENPFYGFHRNYPTRPRYYYPPSPTIKTTPAHKVVSIPVHYVGSERSRLDSAVKIQKMFRGFLVRKSMKKILEIRKEVNEIEKRILMKETVELIRKDCKERLKVNEMLMSLLFRLDSVRGVDSGVRDCRKAVIKKAIRLQEMVDSIVASEIDDRAEDVENLGKIGEEDAEQTLETQDKATDLVNSASNSNTNSLDNVVDRKLELQNHVESISVRESVSMANVVEAEEIGGDANVEDECSVSEEESQADSSANPQSLIEGDVGDDDDSLKNHENGEINQKEGDVKEQCCGEGKSRELLEKMMEDNEKMMGLMAEIFERNEMQTKLLTSLSQRVEQLERALMCERLKRKKKKRNAAGLVDCLESTQDMKKCGKK